LPGGEYGIPHSGKKPTSYTRTGDKVLFWRFFKKKLVITYHGSDLHGIVDQKGKKTLNGRILSTFSRLIARRADCCIAVSNQIAQLLSGKCKILKSSPLASILVYFSNG